MPLIVYFSEELSGRLNLTASERHVAKANLVRFAVERLLNQLSTGQLELPLGV